MGRRETRKGKERKEEQKKKNRKTGAREKKGEEEEWDGEAEEGIRGHCVIGVQTWSLPSYYRLRELSEKLHRIPCVGVIDIWKDNDGGRCYQNAHRGKNNHRRRQRNDLPDGLLALALTKTRKVRHVERKRPPKARSQERWGWEGCRHRMDP